MFQVVGYYKLDIIILDTNFHGIQDNLGCSFVVDMVFEVVDMVLLSSAIPDGY